MLRLISHIFEIIVGLRNFAYDKNIFKTHKCKAIVISVGNLSVGGTGKTPFVIMLSKLLAKNNFKLVVIGRGYGRKYSKYCIVSDGENINQNPEESGDEMILIAEKTNSIVIAHNKKYEAALITDKKYSPDIIIVDDGFQHRKLFRDIDILLIDEQTVEKPFLLPHGRLREPLSSNQRANIICVKKNINQKYLKRFQSSSVLFRYSNFPSGKYLYFSDSENLEYEIERSKEGITLVSAIANHNNFENSVRNLEFNIIENINFSDHRSYSEKDVKEICDKMNEIQVYYLGTTQKDFIKLRLFENIFRENKIKILVFEIETKIVEDKVDFTNYILEKIKNAKK
jgi:tetraacyldisaccharide 4'-kinase